MMEFAHPEAFGLLLLVPLALLAMRSRKGKPVHVAGPLAGWLPGPSPRIRARRLLRYLPLLGIAFLAVALAQPRVGVADALVPAEGIDIVLVLDVSSSMEQRMGPQGDRLDVTKAVVREFIKNREDDQIGLVVFREDAIPLSPPTLDHRALDNLVADIDPEILNDGTGIGVAIGAAVNMLQESPAASRVVILLTDGTHNESSLHPLDAAQLANVFGIRVYTIGIGSSTRGAFGGVDVELLREVAERTGASYFGAETPADLAAVYDEIGRLETSRVSRERFVAYDEYAPWLAAAGGALLVLLLVLRGTCLRAVPA